MDSELYTYLKELDEYKDGIIKWVLIDACHSFGFWGDNNPNKNGDLEKLNNIFFIASADEDKDAIWQNLTNPWRAYGYFSTGLVDALTINDNGKINGSNERGILTPQSLANYLYRYVEIFVGTEGLILGFGDPVVFSMDMYSQRAVIKGEVRGIGRSGAIPPINYLLLLED